MLRSIIKFFDDMIHWRILCDTCKYDYGNVCTRPERPNARKCPDYKRR